MKPLTHYDACYVERDLYRTLFAACGIRYQFKGFGLVWRAISATMQRTLEELESCAYELDVAVQDRRD